MNSLSWMIYLADVAGSLKSVFWAAAFIGCAVYAAFLIHGNFRWFVHGDDQDGIMPRLAATWRQAMWLAAPLVFASFIPSSATIYAIAASEMGETALNSETGGKAVKALNAWLDRQIAGEPEAPESAD